MNKKHQVHLYAPRAENPSSTQLRETPGDFLYPVGMLNYPLSLAYPPFTLALLPPYALAVLIVSSDPQEGPSDERHANSTGAVNAGDDNYSLISQRERYKNIVVST